MKTAAVILSLSLTAVVSAAVILLFGLASPAADRSCPLPATLTARVTTSTGFVYAGGGSVRLARVVSTTSARQTVRALGHTGPGGTGSCVALGGGTGR